MPATGCAAASEVMLVLQVTALQCRFHMEAVNGSNTAERPMWAEKGGLDFEGRAKWDAWTAVKGMRPDKAKLEFVKVLRCLRTSS